MSSGKDKRKQARSRAFVHVVGSQHDRRCELAGRDLWALRELMEAGEEGITSRDFPGVHLAGHVRNLREVGVDIETIREKHGGEFPGMHARYVLRSRVRLERPPDHRE